MLEFVTAWDTAVLTAKRFEKCEVFGDMAGDQIPHSLMTSVAIPKRGDKDARTPPVQQGQTDYTPPPYDNSNDIKTPVEEATPEAPLSDG